MDVELTQDILHNAGIGNFFRPGQLNSLGIPYHRLRRLKEEKRVEQVGRGLYRLTGTEPTEHYSVASVSARVPKGVVCLLSALQVHGIGAQLPRHVWVGIPHKAKAPVLNGTAGVKIVRFSSAALTWGVTETSFEGVPARVTSPARTIVDCFRFQRLVGPEIAVAALRESLEDNRVTPAELMRALDVLPSRRLRAVMEAGIL